MIYNKWLFVFITFPLLTIAQDIKVNEKKFTTLIFESNIVSGIVGNEDFIFEFNQDEADNMALLKAVNKSALETSLVIKTENGTIFNLNVLYGVAEKNIVHISDTLGVSIKVKNIENKITHNSNSNTKVNNSELQAKKTVREDDYTIGNTTLNDNENKQIECVECENILKAKKTIKRVFDENYNVKAQINDIYYFQNKLYFVVNFINESDLDYSFNYIKSYIDTNNDSKVSTTQYLEKNPLFIYNTNRTIRGGTSRVLIFVYDQFSIDNNKKVVFEINESNGERNLSLKVPHYLVNNPKRYKK
jgi:hypothetical protein